ncbi:MAG TPA: phospholipase D-like domain-containing protein [Longimicrobiales bacterium]|nr:phospholipase D-like domain-containing protein [Longimicrobiales bacterium]
MVIWIMGSLLVVAVAIAVQHMMRGTPIERLRCIGGGEETLHAQHPQFRQAFELLTRTRIWDTNRLEVLFNGDQTYERIFSDLRAAERLIIFHVFWFKPGRLAEQLRTILEERARAGVTVLFLLDYWGSKGLGREYPERLRAAGVEVALFRPLRFGNLHKVQQRMHVRCVVIDNTIGWTGGFGIDDRWLGDGVHPGQWRDTNVRLYGPTVHQLAAAFSTNWAEATGDLLTGSGWFQDPEDGPAGECRAGLMFAAPTLGSTNAERFFALSTVAAHSTLYITNAYFTPDAEFRRMLIEAVDRGVDVRVLTPGGNTDEKSVWYAGRAHYEELLAGGVRLYEYEPAMVHAKTIIADGVWGCVGTLNFDNRSMSLNDEVAVIFWDEDIGDTLHRQFLEDLEHAREVELAAFRRRGPAGRLLEQSARIIVRIL